MCEISSPQSFFFNHKQDQRRCIQQKVRKFGSHWVSRCVRGLSELTEGSAFRPARLLQQLSHAISLALQSQRTPPSMSSTKYTIWWLTRNLSWRILTCCKSQEVTFRGAAWKEASIVGCFRDQADPIWPNGRRAAPCTAAGERCRRTVRNPSRIY